MTTELNLRLLPSDNELYRDIIKPGQYIRTLHPYGYVYRLPEGAEVHTVRHQAHLLSHAEREQFTEKITIENEGVDDKITAAFTAGLLLGRYQPGFWKSEEQLHPLAAAGSLITFSHDSSALASAYLRERTLVDTQMEIMALVDAPANIKRPQYLAAWAEKSGKKYGYDVQVLDKAACEAEGLGALLAVNRGSEDPARFIIMQYKYQETGAAAGAGEGTEQDQTPLRKIAIIGKGITFDTGGVSIKGSQNLHLMKSDMGGAAAVFGTMEAIAKLKVKAHVIGIVPATDNSVDALSIKPSDVITGHSGKTIEIIDTDAEGRLVMSDGLSYANKYFQPDYLLDIATLTGSAVRTFGYECGALMSKNQAMSDALLAAGTASGEKLWPLPTWDAYRAGLDSDVADIKNYSGRPINGAIDAFKFLEFFTDEHPAFAHLDIAGVALKQGPFAKDRQATGFGMRLLVEWLEGL
ncbi:M17 family metallopeptidase [Lewinella sp. 4G2]|uniref:leucyl aminopeptidase family protein n=1 Tax=Lewinella sp. 4G2 TaxID=1803372 RepID=UPI0007B4B98B|nr:leucyl aminopeptidase family protein [Lewinella sp. 4G2]OAV44176.1 hypothetical protein A3850_006550 [Lewinella sp. 4G2]